MEIMHTGTTEPCPTDSTSEGSGDDQIQPILIDQHKALEKALENLHQLASSIRRASVPNSKFYLSARLSNESKIYDPNFRDSAKLLLKYRFPSASGSLLDQLADSMSRRRNWLLYNYRHAQKLRQDRDHLPSSIASKPTPIQGIVNPIRSAEDAAQVTAVKQAQTLAPQKAQFSTYSYTEASRLSVRQDFTKWRAPSSVRSNRTGTQLRSDQGVYPPIPKFHPGDKFCSCPYCLESLPTEKLDQLSYWRAHYDDDTKPFVCLSEDCSDPPQFFSRLAAWEEHMTGQHSEDWTRTIHSTVWYCDIDECKFEEKKFYLQRELEDHLKSKLTRKYSTNQVSALVVRKKRGVLRDPMNCPLCKIKVDAGPERGQSLMHHIGGHLHYLNSICAPQMDLSSEEVNSESDPGVEKTCKGGSDTDSRRDLISDAERDEPFTKGGLSFQDEDRVPEVGESAVNCYYTSPRWVKPNVTVDRLYFVVKDYDPLQDTVLQNIARDQAYTYRNPPKPDPPKHRAYKEESLDSAQPSLGKAFGKAGEGDETGEYLNKKRIQAVQQGRSLDVKLGCPFAKGDPDNHTGCLGIMRQNLNGVK
ncbi:hypothetical protein TWF281_011053 [Arthrobotrys megalospora]